MSCKGSEQFGKCVCFISCYIRIYVNRLLRNRVLVLTVYGKKPPSEFPARWGNNRCLSSTILESF